VARETARQAAREAARETDRQAARRAARAGQAAELPTGAPAPDGRPGVASLARRTLRLAAPYTGWLLGGLLFTALFAAGRYGRAWLLQPLLDDVLLPAQGAAQTATQAEPLARFRELALLALGITAVVPAALFARSWALHYVLGRINVDVKQALAAKLLRLPLSFHREGRSGDRVSRLLLDVDQSQHALELLFLDLAQAGVMVAIGAGTLLWISWQLALCSLLAAPPIVAVLWVFSGRVRRGARRRQEQQGEVTQRLLGILSGIKVIKAFRGEAVETAAFRRATRSWFRRAMRVVKNRLLSRSLAEGLNTAVGMAVLMLGAWLVTGGRWGLSVGDVAAFAAVMATTYRPVKTLSGGWPKLMESLASAERFFELLDAPEEPADPDGALSLQGIREGVRFEDVHFSYGREPVLRGVSLEVRAGEVVALVGPTGSGKSTLVDLLLRFHAPDAGRILVDGVDLRRIRRDSVLEHVALVTQEPFLFDASVRENVLYGRPDAGEDELQEALRTAHVDEFLARLPYGADTEVGELGLRLSGGQRQRITIARALLKDAPLLVLDEATSALDARTERAVQEAIEAQRGRHALLVIAHRLSTVRRADRIVVLEKGVVSDQGTHDELMARGGLYRELVALSEERPASREG